MKPAGRSALRVLACAALFTASGCSLPWKSALVAPGVAGRVERSGHAVVTGRVRQQVRSHDNATLGAHVEVALGSNARFAFEPVHLRVAGQEYGKDYFLLLYWLEGDEARVLWRADYSRLRLGAPIELHCDLGRTAVEGPPCQLAGDPAAQPWLLDAGERDYRALCAQCHGPAARGTEAGPDLTRIAARRGGRFPHAEIARWIDGRRAADAHGRGDMPVWGLRLQDEALPAQTDEERVRNRIDILVLYLETLQRGAS